MSKKKVLFFTPGGVGGAERMTITVAKLLPQERYEVKFVVIGTLNKIYDFIPKEYSCDCIPVHNKYCLSTYRIYRKIKKEKADLVYTSQAAYNPRVIIAACMAKVPVICRSSGMVGTYKKGSMFMVKQTYKRADLLIAQQEDMRQEMHQLLGINLDRIVTLYNVLDTANVEIKSESESPFPAKQINYVNVSRVNKDKGHDFAITAFANVVKKTPNAHLYFVGDYSENDDFYKWLKNLTEELKLQNNVHFVGYDNNPYRWIKHCDCFVFPSRREGLPNALIEASYLEKPCVASRCLSIISEIIKDGVNGYTTSVGSVEELSKAMVKCVELTDCKMLYKPSCKEDYIKVFDRLTLNEILN